MSDPKISINKLGEYLTATPSRRRRIIEDQQNPKPFIVTRYADARDEIVNYLASNMEDDSAISQAAQQLRVPNGGTDFAIQDRYASAEAIDSFLEAAEDINLDGLSVERVDTNSPSKMEISGVLVSMRPDALLRDTASGDVVGCIKLHFPKSSPLTTQGAEYVATAMRIHLESLPTPSKIDNKKCFVVDVPTQNVVTAPKSFKRKMNDIEAACEEIEVRWKK
jgi:hypothetical protein